MESFKEPWQLVKDLSVSEQTGQDVYVIMNDRQFRDYEKFGAINDAVIVVDSERIGRRVVECVNALSHVTVHPPTEYIYDLEIKASSGGFEKFKLGALCLSIGFLVGLLLHLLIK